MTAETGAWIKRHITERFGLGRIDHLPDVDAHCLVDDLQFVDERDVDRSENVLGNFHRFSRRRR